MMAPIADRLAPGAVAGEMPARLSAPQVRAAEAIQRAMDRDAMAGHVADTTQPLRHTGGENVAGLYDVIAQSPGPGRQIMRTAIDAHRTATSAAIRQDIGDALGGQGDYFAAQKALSDARAAAGGPKLREAFDTPIGTDTFDKTFAPIMARLPQGAAEKAANLARMAGRNPDELGLTMMDDFAGNSARNGAAAPEKVSLRDLKSVQRGSKVGFGQGPSLLSFLAKSGGLQDQGGELSAMDAGQWHRGGPFRSKLIQPDGLTLEDAAQRAHDAGYFPNHFAGGGVGETHAVPTDDLLGAIRSEIAGKPSFAREPDPKALARLGRLDNLSGRLRNANADIGGLDKASAGQALADHDADLYRLEAHLDGDPMPMSGNVQASAVTPTLETLHFIKRGIDQTLEPYRNQVSGRLDLSSPEASAANKVRGDLGRAMRKVSKPYDEAMQQWGDDSDHINALKMGRDVFSSKFDMQSENLRSLHGEMSDESKAQFQKGVGEAIIAEVRRKGDISAVRRLLGDHADEFRDRVSLAFNDDPVAFGRFIESMGVHADNAARDASYIGNSRTFGRDAARKDLEGDGGALGEVVGGIGDVLTGNLPRLTARGARAAYKSLGARHTSALTDPNANAMMARAGNNPDDLTAMLNMLQARRRIAAAPQSQGRVGSALGRDASIIAGRAQ